MKGSLDRGRGKVKEVDYGKKRRLKSKDKKHQNVMVASKLAIGRGIVQIVQAIVVQ